MMKHPSALLGIVLLGYAAVADTPKHAIILHAARLLDVETVLMGEKTLVEVGGECLMNGEPFQGYEMHIGQTQGPDCARPLMRFADGRLDGATSADGRVMGAYVHGLFAGDRQRAAWLAALGASSELEYETTVEQTLDALADRCEAHLDCEALLAAAR